jgi:RND family efflux transporter MFP subunit
MPQVDLASLAVKRDAARRPSYRRRHWWSRYFVPMLLIGGFVGLVAWATRDWVFPATPVTTTRVFSNRGEVQGARGELFRAAGWVEPRPTAIRVAALAPGVVRRLLVVEDQAVRMGEPVAELVDEDAKLEVRRASADLKLREAELEVAQAAQAAAQVRFERPVHLQAALSEAAASLAEVDTAIAALPFELRQAEAERNFARLDHQRKSNALDSISQRAVDEAKSLLDSREAAVEQIQKQDGSLRAQRTALSSRSDALRQQLELLADEIKARDEAIANVKAAEARLEQARVELANAELRLARMTIAAPVDGRVFRLIAQPGASVGASMTSGEDFDGSTIVTLYQPTSMQVRADVRFENLPLVLLGQRVEIANPALKTPLPGKVLFINSKADIQKNTLQVKIGLETPNEFLRPDMLVEATFLSAGDGETPASEDAIRVFAPRQFVLSGTDGNYVWVADQRLNRAAKTPVTVGVQLGDLVEITAGLNPSHRLIASGIERLRDGQRIRIVEHAGGEPAAAEQSQSRFSQ